MESQEPARFTSIQPVLDDLLPIVRSFAVGRYAVAISGSYGKGTPDSRADLDLRLYADELSAPFAAMGEAIRPDRDWSRVSPAQHGKQSRQALCTRQRRPRAERRTYLVRQRVEP